MTLEEYNKLRNSIDKIADLLIEILSVIKTDQQQAQQPEQPKLERWKPEKYVRYWAVQATGAAVNQIFDSNFDEECYNNYNCFQTEQEGEQEALRTRARRKLEWYARQLGFPHTKPAMCSYAISKNGGVISFSNEFNTLTDVIFNTKEAAEYALSQMTSEELEALR